MGDGKASRQPPDFSVAAAAAVSHSFLVPHSITTGWWSQSIPPSSHWSVRGEMLWGRRAAFFFKRNEKKIFSVTFSLLVARRL